MAVMDMNYETFDKIVRQDKSLALVEYSAPWCVYCRRIGPAYKKLAEEMDGKLVFGAVNIDDVPRLAEEYKVELIPTFMIFKDGQPVSQIVAPGSKAQIEEFLQPYL